jgi:hypothetical protein
MEAVAERAELQAAADSERLANAVGDRVAHVMTEVLVAAGILTRRT